MAEEELSLAPEIAQLRAMLRQMGSDSEEERETVAAGIKGVARLVSALVQCVRLENDLQAPDDDGVGRSLEAILARAAVAIAEEKPRRAVGDGADA